jgi:hypothetical protein
MVLDGLLAEREDPTGDTAERRRYYQLTGLGRRVAILEAERHADLLRAAIDGGLVSADVLASARNAKRKAR